MSINKYNLYDVENHIAELYDNVEKEVEDVNFIIELLKQYECKNILEPFCGTGRILLPIASEGFNVTGIDESEVMLNRLHTKIESKSDSIKDKITIIKANLVEYSWPKGYDAVVLGGNCFFELASLEEQQKILYKAYETVKDGGYIFISNDNIEDELPDSWCNLNVENESFPSGICEDGIELKGYSKPIYVDKKNKIWKAQRRLEIYDNSELIKEYTWEQQKHPIGYSEIVNIVNNLNLSIVNVWGSIAEKKKFTTGDNKAIFWLRKN